MSIDNQDIDNDWVNGLTYSNHSIGHGCRGCRAKGFSTEMRNKLNVSDYMCDLPNACNTSSYVEVQFKNTRKGYFLNSLKLDLHKGDMVVVEAPPGYDLGEVTLTGRLVDLQMKKINYRHPNGEPRRVYRVAKPIDLDRYEEVKALEHDTMIRSRKIAESLGLDMKIGDVEYQGDGMKAIFYYIAEGRVDFRQLIRKLAEAFHIRVEMKQIGARQEAGRIGGIGPCGRQLCCSSWMTNFVSVGTNAARIQDLSLNPQKLAGQCAKLKCCLNYEVDTYCEAQKKIPSKNKELVTSLGEYKQIKADTIAGLITYVPKQKNNNGNNSPIVISKERAWEVIRLNERGEIPFSLDYNEEGMTNAAEAKNSKDLLDQSSLSRFDSAQSNKEKKRNKRRRNNRKTEEVNAKSEEITANESIKKAAIEGAIRRREKSENNPNALRRKSIRRGKSRRIPSNKD